MKTKKKKKEEKQEDKDEDEISIIIFKVISNMIINYWEIKDWYFSIILYINKFIKIVCTSILFYINTEIIIWAIVWNKCFYTILRQRVKDLTKNESR